MKRLMYLVILLAVAAAFYVYAYPRLAGGGTASAQQAAQGQATQGQPAKGGGAARGGGFATSVVTAVAQKQTLPITKSAVGFIEPAESVVVRPRADGAVLETDVTEGQTVKAGDVLFKLDDRSIQATIAKDQAQIAKDQANADAANAALEREQDLVKKGVDPQSSLDVAVAAQKVAQATVTVDQAQLSADQVTLSYMTITAPIAGRVGTVNTSVGNLVHAADTSADGLLTITRMDQLRVSFSIAEGDLDSFRNALKAGKALPVSVLAPGDTAARSTGKLSFIDSSVDTGSGTIVLKADVDNTAAKLWPGQYVTAITQLGSYTDATTIPLQAIQQSDNGGYVYVVGPDQKVKKQPVTTVATIGTTAVVGKEVKPGDHVVIEGQLRLAAGAPVKETVQQPATQVADNQATGGSPPTGAGSNATSGPPATPGGASADTSAGGGAAGAATGSGGGAAGDSAGSGSAAGATASATGATGTAS